MAKIMGNTTATAIMVDDKLSLDSKNPIQNKVVTQELNKKINFMGEINENLLPTENNNIGDMYKIFSQKYVEKPYVSGTFSHEDITDCYYIGVGEEGLYTSEEHDELIAKNYFDVPIECTVYDTDWHFICNADIGYRNDCGGWCIGSSLGVGMQEGITYHIVRSDDLGPMDTSLPIQSIPCGRIYKKYLLSGKYIYNEWQPANGELQSGWGFSFYEGLLADGEDMSVHIPVNIYDTSHNILGTGELYFRGEISLWVFETQTVPLTENETYYIERADGKIPVDLEPTTVEEFEKVVKGYAIYNGESFDKFYNDETVDKKIAEVEEAKVDISHPYEYIETVTLTEDVTEVNLSTEPDGTPYNFDKLLVYSIAQKATARDNLRLNVNGGYCGAVTNGLYNEWSSHSIFEVYGDKQVDKLVVRLGNYTNAWSNISNMNTSYVVNSKCNSIKNIRFFAYNVSIPTGTTFEIWGVRA